MITANTDTRYEQNWIVWLIGLGILRKLGIWNVKYTKTKARQTEQRLTATDLESKSESSRLWLCVDETARSIYTLLDLDLQLDSIA